MRRINSANADAVLSALQAGGSYWYPIDGCYQLTEDLTLPEDWKPIKGFKGHWNSDVYTVTLNSKGTPLLDNTRMDGESGWNLGVNRAKGTQTVFNSGMTRTTGVARVLGDLNDLFGTDMDYAGYTVKILGKFHGIQTFLTVDKVDIAQHGTHFRVKYTAISSHGTKMEWYSNIADEKSGAWTTDTGMFGGDVSQSIKNNSNILNVKRPELEIITTPSALCGGAPYIDTMTPDEYGQMLLLSNAAATMANGTATYEAILYYKPGDLVPTPTWQYMTYTDHAPKFWADSTGNKWTGSKAQQLGVNVTVTNTDLGDALYQGQPGYKAIKSVMTISNVPASMYNPETLSCPC